MMNRSPFQVLVFPYRLIANQGPLYCIFKRNPETGGYWQGIAGGGEQGETPLDAAKREAHEEANISPNNAYMQLDSLVTIPVEKVCGFLWGSDILVIPEYSFGVKLLDENIILSNEHTEYKWVGYKTAYEMLHWDSNKNALWELNYRVLCT
jgi:dATP pyrophosphohydrolase